jgi:hypothetical protein
VTIRPGFTVAPDAGIDPILPGSCVDGGVRGDDAEPSPSASSAIARRSSPPSSRCDGDALLAVAREGDASRTLVAPPREEALIQRQLESRARLDARISRR